MRKSEGLLGKGNAVAIISLPILVIGVLVAHTSWFYLGVSIAAIGVAGEIYGIGLITGAGYSLLNRSSKLMRQQSNNTFESDAD